jgi:hypothetical protein
MAGQLFGRKVANIPAKLQQSDCAVPRAMGLLYLARKGDGSDNLDVMVSTDGEQDGVPESSPI